MWINLEGSYDEAVHRLKEYYALKANQGMIEHLVREEAIRLGIWPIPANGHKPPQPEQEQSRVAA